MDETSILPVEERGEGRPRSSPGAGLPRPSAGAGLARRALAWVSRLSGGRGAVEEFAGRLASARSAAEVRQALAEAAGRLSGGAAVRFDHDAVGASGTLVVPLRFGGRVVGTLRLVPDRPRDWPPLLARRVEALAALASAAEQALASAARPTSMAPGGESSRDPATGLHSAGFFEGYLGHAVALATRRREPLALLLVEPDGLAELRRRDGPEFADSALGLVARALVATLRASDLVARLDSDRLAAVLPAASRADALRVAEVVRRAVGEAGVASSAPGGLTASFGLAALPDDARAPESLHAAAVAALAEARVLGGDQVRPELDRPAASARGSARAAPRHASRGTGSRRALP